MRSFVRDMESDANDQAIITAIIAMAHKLNLEVVAEGVETREQALLLRQFNCDHMQGYWISRPLPLSAGGDKRHPDPGANRDRDDGRVMRDRGTHRPAPRRRQSHRREPRTPRRHPARPGH